MSLKPESPWFLVIAALIFVFVLAVILLVQPRELAPRIILGQNDFMQLYVGARYSGSPAMYSLEVANRVQGEVAGVVSDSILYSRLPFYSVLLRPLAWLPYRTAYYTFEAISFSAFIFFLWMFLPGCRQLVFYASLSIPFMVTLEVGQDSTLVLMFAALSIFLLRKNLDFWAGFALSFCAIKLHIVILVPVVVLMKRRWPVLWGALASGSILFVLNFVGAGADWLQVYIAALRNPALHPGAEHMPNLHTISAVIGGAPGAVVEVILSIAVVAAVFYLSKYLADYELAFAFAIVGSLLISLHSYTQDCVILLLPLAILLKEKFSKGATSLMELAVSPIPFFCLYFGVPYNLVMPALLLAILGVAVVQRLPATE